jgi:proteasome lid subunit RPN8/RPN11
MSQQADDLHESIQLGEVEVTTMEVHSPPLDEHNHRTWGSVEDLPVRIILRQQAYLQILSHARSDLRQEVGGALVGSVYQSAGQTYVEVDGALPARMTRSSATHLTFSAETWVEIQDDLAQHYPSSRIVGWYHTHPGIGVFFSRDDLFIHKHFFKEPWHLALVVDPLAWQARFFIWHDQEIIRANGCYEILDVANRISLVESLIPIAPIPKTEPEEQEEGKEERKEETVLQHPLLILILILDIWRLLLRMVRRLVGGSGETDEVFPETEAQEKEEERSPEVQRENGIPLERTDSRLSECQDEQLCVKNHQPNQPQAETHHRL